jgi:hypothetical protein
MIAEAINAAVAALEAEGLRVAVRSGDITPPVCYLQVGLISSAGQPFSGGVTLTLYVYYIPVRGVDNLPSDSDALDRIYAALESLAIADLVTTRTTITVANETWPCYRADLPALAIQSATAPLEARSWQPS